MVAIDAIIAKSASPKNGLVLPIRFVENRAPSCSTESVYGGIRTGGKFRNPPHAEVRNPDKRRTAPNHSDISESESSQNETVRSTTQIVGLESYLSAVICQGVDVDGVVSPDYLTRVGNSPIAMRRSFRNHP